MVDDDKSEKKNGKENPSATSETDKESGTDDSGEDEGELTPVKPKVGEPAGNLRRRAEWFRKRH